MFGDHVSDEMVDRAMNATYKGKRVWQHIGYGGANAQPMMRAALAAALLPPAGAEAVAWACTDYDGHVGVGLTKAEAKANAGEGCEHFFALLAGPHEIDTHPAPASLEGGEVAKLIERLKVAGRALVRERKIYFEDIETLLDVVRLLESLAASPTQPDAGYRLLTRADVIEVTDECLSDETWQWSPVGKAIIGPGMPYNPGFFVPMRRKVAAQAQGDAGANHG